jgi:hypothetical protein
VRTNRFFKRPAEGFVDGNIDEAKPFLKVSGWVNTNTSGMTSGKRIKFMEKLDKDGAETAKCFSTAWGCLRTIRGVVTFEFGFITFKAGVAIGVYRTIFKPSSKGVTNSSIKEEVFECGSPMCYNVETGLFGWFVGCGWCKEFVNNLFNKREKASFGTN